MTLDEKLQLAVRVAEAFKAREMKPHLARLRSYYRRTRSGRPCGDGEWSDDFVELWAKTLRVPPHETALEVRPCGSKCGCGDTRHHGARSVVFPDGWRTECLGCGRQWLELSECGT